MQKMMHSTYSYKMVDSFKHLWRKPGDKAVWLKNQWWMQKAKLKALFKYMFVLTLNLKSPNSSGHQTAFTADDILHRD